MAVAQTIPVQDNGAAALLASIFGNSDKLFGSGETTTKETTNPLDLTASNNVLNQVLQGTNPEAIDQMIQGIMDKAKDAFGPNISNSLAAGNRALTDTTLATIQGKAMGTATAQAAQAKLEAIAKNNQIAATIVDSQVAGQARVAAANSTKTSKTASSPTGKLLQAAGIATAGYSGYKKIKDANKVKTVSDMNDFFTNNGGGGLSANSQTGTASADQAAEFFSGDTASAGGVAGETGAALDATSLIDVSDASAASSLFEANAFGATDSAAGLAGATAEDAAGFFGGDAALGIAGEAGADAGILGAGAVATAGEVAEGFTLADAGMALGATAVICTELMKQELLDKELWAKAKWYRGNLNQYTLIGYHYWAIPYVRLMKKFPLATKFITPWAVGRYKYIAGEWNFRGWLTCKIGEPVCTLIGKLVTPNLFLDLPEKQNGRNSER